MGRAQESCTVLSFSGLLNSRGFFFPTFKLKPSAEPDWMQQCQTLVKHVNHVDEDRMGRVVQSLCTVIIHLD